MNGDRLNTFWVIVNDAHYREAYNALFARRPGRTAPTTADVPADRQARAGGVRQHDAPTTRRTVTRVSSTSPRRSRPTNTRWSAATPRSTPSSRRARLRRRSRPPPSAARGCSSARRRASTATTARCSPTGGFHDIGVPQVGDHVPTVADCWPGNGQLRLHAGRQRRGRACRRARGRACCKLTASVEPATGVNFNNSRRDSMWSDDPTTTRARAYYGRRRTRR